MSRAPLAALLALGLLLGPGPGAAGPRPERVYDYMALDDMEQLGRVLRRRVAHLRIELKPPPGQVAMDDERDGFGVPIEADLVATQALVLQDATKVVVEGPGGRLPGEVVLYDAERRVALVRTRSPLARIGLETAPPCPPGERSEDLSLFALASTEGLPSPTHGWMTDDGSTPELEGHPRVSFSLSHGMPIFDARARWVGLARAVAWDSDKQLILPVELVAAARTATAAAAQEAVRAASKKGERWWDKKSYVPPSRRGGARPSPR